MWWEVKVVVSVVFLGFHIYSQISDVSIYLPWSHLTVSVRKLIRGCKGKQKLPLLSAKESLKMRYFASAMVFSRFLLGMFVILNLLCGSVGLHSFFAQPGGGVVAITWYGLFLFHGTGFMGCAAWHADVAGYIVTLGLTVRVLMFPSNSMLFFVNHAQRLLVLLLGGFSFFDYRKAIGCLCTLAIAHFFRFYDQYPRCQDGFFEHGSLFASSCSTEIVCFLMLGMVFYLVEMMIDECLLAKIDKQVAETTRNAAQRLLSVLCDADIVLAHDLRIVGQTAKLSHILSSLRPRDEALEGRSFLSLLRREDQMRFHDFIQASSLCMFNHSIDLRDHTKGVGPPSSLQVCICDPAGLRTLKVEIFHVVLPDIAEPNEPCHLLGLREYVDLVVSSPEVKKMQIKDRSGLAVPSCETKSLSTHVHREDALERKENRKCTEDIARGSQDFVPPHVAPDSDTNSLSSGGSSQKSIYPLPHVAGVDVVVVVDPDHNSMPIESMTISFNLEAFSGLSARHRPDLKHWLLGSTSKTLRPWLTNQVNKFIYGENCQAYGRATIRSPFGDSKNKTTSSKVTLAWAEVDEDDGEIRAQIELRSLSELYSSGKSKSMKDVEFWQPMPIIDETT